MNLTTTWGAQPARSLKIARSSAVWRDSAEVPFRRVSESLRPGKAVPSGEDVLVAGLKPGRYSQSGVRHGGKGIVLDLALQLMGFRVV